MKRLIFLFGLITAFIFLLGTSLPAQAENMKVSVCHIPPGNPDNFHTIIVSENAVPAHLAHGDLLGVCDSNAEELCNDNNPCTIDAFLPGTTTCDNSQPTDCSDGTSCTEDSCDPTLGCANTPVIICESDFCTFSTCNGTGEVPFCDETPTEVCEDGFQCDPVDGCVASSATIGDTVFKDTNESGVQDIDGSELEPGLAGVTVALDCGGGPVNQVTNANGNYLFTDIPTPATCTVTVTSEPPDEYTFGCAGTSINVPTLNGGDTFLDADFCIVFGSGD